MINHDLARDRQTQPSPALHSPTRAVRACEPLEDQLPLIDGNTVAIVLDLDHDMSVDRVDENGDNATRIPVGVVDHAANDTRQLAPPPADLTRGSPTDSETSAWRATVDLREHDVVEIDKRSSAPWLRLAPRPIEAREIQQVP